MPVAWAPAFQSAQWAATESTRVRPASSSMPKGHASSFCKSSGCQAKGRVSSLHTRTYGREFTKRKRARRKFYTCILCFASEMYVYYRLILYSIIFCENKRAVSNYAFRGRSWPKWRLIMHMHLLLFQHIKRENEYLKLYDYIINTLRTCKIYYFDDLCVKKYVYYFLLNILQINFSFNLAFL